MKWYHTQRDKRPDDTGQVLISVNGVYYIATYLAEEKKFKVVDEDKILMFGDDDHHTYWTDFNNVSESN